MFSASQCQPENIPIPDWVEFLAGFSSAPSCADARLELSNKEAAISVIADSAPCRMIFMLDAPFLSSLASTARSRCERGLRCARLSTVGPHRVAFLRRGASIARQEGKSDKLGAPLRSVKSCHTLFFRMPTVTRLAPICPCSRRWPVKGYRIFRPMTIDPSGLTGPRQLFYRGVPTPKT